MKSKAPLNTEEEVYKLCVEAVAVKLFAPIESSTTFVDKLSKSFHWETVASYTLNGLLKAQLIDELDEELELELKLEELFELELLEEELLDELLLEEELLEELLLELELKTPPPKLMNDCVPPVVVHSKPT